MPEDWRELAYQKVEKSKPAAPRILEDEDARRMERSKQLIEDTESVIRKTRLLVEQSRLLIRAGMKISMNP